MMNISILSDNNDIKRIIHSNLNHFMIHITYDTDTFFNELLFTKYDLLIIDFEAQKVDELIYSIKKNHSMKIPIIYFLERFDFNYFKKFGYNVGDIDYLVKPLVNNQFIQKINQYNHSLDLDNKLSNIEDFMLQYCQSVIQSQMLSIISHQWRQPLNIIATSIINLELKSELEELQHKDIEKTAQKIHSVLEQTTHAINDYNTIFRQSLTKNEFNAIEVYNDCLSLIEPQLISHKIKIENFIPDKTIFMTNYKNELSQTLLSLLSISKDLILTKQQEEKDFDGSIKLSIEQKDKQITFKIVNKKINVPSSIFFNGLTIHSLLKNSLKSNDIKLFVAKHIIEEKLMGTLCIANHQKDLVFTMTL